MGLFDDLQVFYPLPDPEYQRVAFQTKSFEDPYLNQYRITEDGLLQREYHRQVRIPKAKQEWDALLGRWETKRWVHDRWETIPYHGDVQFYGFSRDLPSGQPDTSSWVEYVARFSEGRVSRVWRVVKEEKG